MAYLTLTLIFLLLLAVLGWHIALTLLGGIIAITPTIWGFTVVSVLGFAIIMLLSFWLLIPGLIAIGLIWLLWCVGVMICFPVVFPILVPLMLVYGFLGTMRYLSQST